MAGGDGLPGRGVPQRGQQRLDAVHVDPAQRGDAARPTGRGGALDGVVAGEQIAQRTGLPVAVHQPGREEGGDPGLVRGDGREHRPRLGEPGGLHAVQHAEGEALLVAQRLLGAEELGVDGDPAGAALRVRLDVEVGAQHGGDRLVEVEMAGVAAGGRHRRVRIRGPDGARGRGGLGGGSLCAPCPRGPVPVVVGMSRRVRGEVDGHLPPLSQDRVGARRGAPHRGGATGNSVRRSPGGCPSARSGGVMPGLVGFVV